MPTSLLETTSTRPRAEAADTSTLLRRVVLALFLHNFDLGSAGAVVNFDQPMWMAQSSQHQPLPVAEKWAAPDSALTQESFRSVVDLAYKTPDFSESETSRRDIILDRTFRGCGTGAGPGFLDFVIALEAALLGGAKTELAYRFSLYGALFLGADREPSITFDQLHRIYKVRSDLVHGTPPKPQAQEAAIRDAADLARAVTRRAIQHGWPQAKQLDKMALTSGFTEYGATTTPAMRPNRAEPAAGRLFK
jgi:hypothetical protein